jgi:hypothetical protein
VELAQENQEADQPQFLQTPTQNSNKPVVNDFSASPVKKTDCVSPFPFPLSHPPLTLTRTIVTAFLTSIRFYKPLFKLTRKPFWSMTVVHPLQEGNVFFFFFPP